MRNRTSTRRMARADACGLLAALLVIATAVIGCTPEKRYKTLSFFFDGVPSPDAGKGEFNARRGTKEKPVYVHRPYAEQKCNACHLNTDDIFARAKVRPNVCMECHAPVKTEHKVMHGPVVNDACTMCHIPHQSGVEHLLRTTAPRICVQCHESLTGNPPEHLDAKANCISCHSGHGGSDHNFLKAIGPKPTTAPAGAPALHASSTSRVTP
jgi:predicted CXXCH cytochrome family protein